MDWGNMLHAEDVTELRTSDPHHGHLLEQTIAYFEGPLDTGVLRGVATAVSRADVPDGMTWVLYGYGNSPRGRYCALAMTPAVEVLWSAPILPLWLYPVALVAAAYGGLVRLRQGSALPDAIEKLGELAMVEAYLVSESLLSTLVAYVRRHRWRSFIGQLAGTDDRYFCLGFDGDNKHSPSGCLGWASYGARCDPALVEAIKPFISAT